MSRACFLFILMCAALPALAETWMVYADGSGDAPTLAAAIDSCVSGDVIVVGSGVYTEGNLVVDGKDIMISGEGFPVISAPVPGSGRGIVIRNVSTAFFLFNVNVVSFETGITVEDAEPAIWVSTIKHCATAVRVTGSGSYINLAYSLIDSCTTAVRIEGASAVDASIVENNTIVNCVTGMSASAGSIAFDLNIVYGCGTGVQCSGASLTFTCNCFYDNSLDYDACTPGSSDFFSDPLFCLSNPTAPGLYYLGTDSPCWKSNNACGQNVGAFTQVDCEGSGFEASTWGTIKRLFR